MSGRRLSVAKSKYSPGPASKSQTVKQEAWEGGVKLTTDGMDSDGKPTHTEYAAKFDGKDYPWKGNPNADMISIKRTRYWPRRRLNSGQSFILANDGSSNASARNR